jgi:adenylosuccinate synthase
VCKAYNTYVGAKEFEKDEKIFEQIREVGNEYGATTGRKRQIAWNNLDDIIKAARINGVTHLVVNKIDVLEKVGKFKIYHEGIERSLVSKEFYQIYFTNVIKQTCPLIREIIFSESAEKI